jgi:hypothetical protein
VSIVCVYYQFSLHYFQQASDNGPRFPKSEFKNFCFITFGICLATNAFFDKADRQGIFFRPTFLWKPQKLIDGHLSKCVFAAFVAGVARFYWRKIPKRGKIYQINTKLTKGHRIYQMAVIHILLMSMECTNLFHFKAHRYLYTQIRIFGLKIYYKSGSPDL